MLIRTTGTILFCEVEPVVEREAGPDLVPVLLRWYEAMQEVVEPPADLTRRFTPPGLMAVFGLAKPDLDNARKAVRVAARMRDRLVELNEELSVSYSMRVQATTGIDTGEIVASDPSADDVVVSGEPVVTAKRLEEAAQPGEILIGRTTYKLVKGSVKAGPREEFLEHGFHLAFTPEPDGSYSWAVLSASGEALQQGVAATWEDARLAAIEHLYPPSRQA